MLYQYCMDTHDISQEARFDRNSQSVISVRLNNFASIVLHSLSRFRRAEASATCVSLYSLLNAEEAYRAAQAKPVYSYDVPDITSDVLGCMVRAFEPPHAMSYGESLPFTPGLGQTSSAARELLESV